MRRLIPLLFVLLLAATMAHAVEPSEMLPDPAQEVRARAISKSLRCVVCQNQSIDDSDAELAHDMRVLVRRRIAAGDSDAQVLSYMRSRYGDFVLLRPRFDATTVLLWTGPALMLVIGAIVLARTVRRRSLPPPPLSAAEREALARIGDSGDARTAS
jgi:cytochrome c-type biogenesis protein CcmH